MEYFTLFPLQGYWGKWLGASISFAALLVGLASTLGGTPILGQFTDPKLTNTWVAWGFAIGLFFLSFSKEKIDDERVQRIRYVAFRGALMMGFMFTLFMFCPAFWEIGSGDSVLAVSDMPFAILFCVIIPLLIFQVVFNVGLYTDSAWAYSDLGAEENIRKNRWLQILLAVELVLCLGLIGLMILKK